MAPRLKVEIVFWMREREGRRCALRVGVAMGHSCGVGTAFF